MATIRGASAEARNGIVTAGSEAKREIGDVAASTKTEIRKLGQVYEAGIQKAGEDYRQSLLGIHMTVEQSLKAYNDDVKKWGDAREECGQLSEIIVHGYRLLGLLKVADGVREVPLEVIAQIFDRLHLWTVYMLPDATSTPSGNVISVAGYLRLVTPIKLSVLTGWLRDEFSRRVEEAKK